MTELIRVRLRMPRPVRETPAPPRDDVASAAMTPPALRTAGVAGLAQRGGRAEEWALSR